MISQKTKFKYIKTICTGPIPLGCYRQIWHMNVCGTLPIEISIATPIKKENLELTLDETELFYINECHLQI